MPYFQYLFLAAADAFSDAEHYGVTLGPTMTAIRFISTSPGPELYKQSADKADEVIDDLDIEFMPPVKEKPSRSKEQQRTKEPEKLKPKREKGPEMAL